MKSKEEVLFRYPFPGTLAGFGNVTLITHTKGDYSLHLQTGEYHERCLQIAKLLLSWRGLRIGNPILLGPSGMYYVVKTIQEDSPEPACPHNFQEQPGEPLVDVCIICGEERQ